MTGPQFTATPCGTCASEAGPPEARPFCDGCVVLPVKVPMVPRHTGIVSYEPHPAWDPRRTAPIVTPCGCLCHADPDLRADEPECDECKDGYVDTGERCSWTLAPVLAERQEHHPNGEHRNGYVRIMGDGTLAHHYRIDGEWEYTHPFTLPFDVSPGDVLAVAEVTP